MSHPTLSGFFPTQTYLVPFIFRTNLQINNWFIAFCWACLQFAEAFLPAASRAHPSLVAAPHASLRATQTHGSSWIWGEKCHGFGSRVEKRQSRCLCVLQKDCVPTPAPSRHHCNLQPSGQKKSSHKTEGGEMRLDLGDGAAWGPRWVRTWLPCSESFPGKAQHEACSTTMGLLLPPLMN